MASMAERATTREILANGWRPVFLTCVAGAVLPLPFGFLNEAVAIGAGIWGLYFVLPMVVAVAGAVLAVRLRPSRSWVRAAVVVIGVAALLHFLYWSLWLLPYSVLAIAPAAVIARAAVVAWRADEFRRVPGSE
jgi:hypothetical protein